jgi:hypothetical protein
MKKRVDFFDGCFLLAIPILFMIVSCNTLKIVTGMPFWSHGEYVNENGDRLGEYFVDWEGEISASFSNSANNNASATLKGLRVSEVYGVTFLAPKITGWYPLFNDTEIDVTVTSNNNIQHFTGVFSLKAEISIPYSTELFNMLLEKTVNIRCDDGRRIYQFNFPAGFAEAWEKRKNKTNL